MCATDSNVKKTRKKKTFVMSGQKFNSPETSTRHTTTDSLIELMPTITSKLSEQQSNLELECLLSG